MTPWDAMIVVGRIVRPHGNKGHVVVAPETDFGGDRFQAGAILQTLRYGEPAPCEIVASREHNGRWIVGLAGVTSIDEAEALRGLELRIPSESLRALGAGGYYVHDLVGCRVETTGGEQIGRVERVELGTGTPVLVVVETAGGAELRLPGQRPGESREVLVPLAEPICRRVDVDAKVVVIDPPDGLIELNE